MKTIPLSAKRRCTHFGKYYAIVDDNDYKWASQFNWTADVHRNGVVYAHRRVGPTNGKKNKVYLHRDIWQRAHGPIPNDVQIDHKEHGLISGLDNRRKNLRLADETQNLANARTRNDNTSGYRGVSWSKRRRKWHAYLSYKGERTHLGLFDDLESAARVRDTEAIKKFGVFARCSFSGGE